jgi:tRNA (mo5U34)-methyltransferase
MTGKEANVDYSSLASEVERFTWYHTHDLGGGVVTKGMFDHRPAVDRYLIPEDLSGMRCLDVGTMDGFWAFEMERRGAEHVVAADLARPDELDFPPLWREQLPNLDLDETKAQRFKLAHAALGSNVERVERSIYDLATDLGEFDLVFCGDLLVHLKDPITAVQRIHGVCRGSAIICNPIKRFRFRRGPLVEFDGITEFQWWLMSEAAMERMLRAVGFRSVEVGPSFELPATGTGDWKGLRAVMRGFV